MKRLYVGCRVRILYSNGWPELAGREGRIVSDLRAITLGPNAGKAGLSVAPDCWGSHVAPVESINGGWEFTPMPEQLEPIQDPGREVISWDQMKDLWQPQGEVA